jgi:VIT1/CCC1 family predicted Fe2+/Mn2+ transporter
MCPPACSHVLEVRIEESSPGAVTATASRRSASTERSNFLSLLFAAALPMLPEVTGHYGAQPVTLAPGTVVLWMK